MSLVKRKGSANLWLDIAVPKALQHIYGARIRESTGTGDKDAAQQLHDERVVALWRQNKLGEKPKVTLRQAITRWEKRAKAERLRSTDDVMFRLNWWAEQLGDDRPVGEIKRSDIMSAVEGMECKPNKNRPDTAGKAATPATINRYLQAIRGLLRLCAGEWEMIDNAPSITLKKEPKGRVRALKVDEISRLLGVLPEHWRPIILFALSTGMRKDNVVRLRWDQVDLKLNRLLVGSDDFKNGEDFGIPLNDTALAVLDGCKDKHRDYVFTYEGEPMQSLQHRTWKKALGKAGITDFRWHDNRHTWATMFVEAGGNLDELQRLGGWESRDMVQRYAHLRTAFLLKSSQKIDKSLCEFLQPKQQVTPQERHENGTVEV